MHCAVTMRWMNVLVVLSMDTCLNSAGTSLISSASSWLCPRARCTDVLAGHVKSLMRDIVTRVFNRYSGNTA